MSYKLVIYSNDLFHEKAEILKQKSSGIFDEVLHYTEEDIKATPFFERNQSILSEKRGAGYWLWKPYIILDSIEKSKPEDKLLYLDSGDVFKDSVRNSIDKCLMDADICLTSGSYRSFIYTKRDCFVLMGCDSPEYWNSNQIEAGIICYKPTINSKQIFNEWLSECEDPRKLTDMPNTCGMDNFPTFRDHRHDQSILNNIAVRKNLKISKEIRSSTRCNISYSDDKSQPNNT